MSKYLETWILEATKLRPGEMLYIPCATKEEQKRFKLELRKLFDRFPWEEDHHLTFGVSFKDKSLWVYIKKELLDQRVAYVKNLDGEVRRIEASTSSERVRIIRCMLEDGNSIEDIESFLGSLSPQERSIFEQSPKEVD